MLIKESEIKILVKPTKIICILFLKWDKSKGEKETSELIYIYGTISS